MRLCKTILLGFDMHKLANVDVTVFDALARRDRHSEASVEFNPVAAWSCLRVTVHDPDLHASLVDDDPGNMLLGHERHERAAGFAGDPGPLTHLSTRVHPLLE